jgi:formylglycine-generating enzyme required for sulfatase activity
LADYRDKLGGLAGAIQSAVNEVLGAAPSKAELDLARRLFIPALVQVDTDGVKRRVAKRENLAAQTLSLADRFVTQRLLVSDQGALEVAHEAILRQWPALAGWIAEERGALATLDGVRAAARDWRSQLGDAKGARGESWLLHRGERLKDAETIAARPDFAGVVDEDMRAYLKACRQVERTQAGRRRGMAALLGVSALAVLGVGAAFVTQDQWRPRLEAHLNYGRFAAENTSAKLMQAAPVTTFQDCQPGSTLCPVMVVIPQGDFLMGERPEQQRDEMDAPMVDAAGKPVMAPDERRRIPVARFAVSETEITFAHWRACVAGGGCEGSVPDDSGWEGDDRPVINVSWDEAKAYAQWLSQATGHEYRLLTEAEWEYAARGVTSVDDPRNGANWSFGDDESLLRDYGWFAENTEQKSQPVRQKRANPFGLYDMHGNVWEWVEDCYAEYDPARLTSAAVETGDRSDSETTCSSRVLRGGSRYGLPNWLRSAIRYRVNPTGRIFIYGFRLARTVLPPES